MPRSSPAPRMVRCDWRSRKLSRVKAAWNRMGSAGANTASACLARPPLMSVMVVVVSAGNLTDLPDGAHWFHNYPDYLADEFSRVASPGTAALAVTVGSTAHSDTMDPARFPGGQGIADVGKPSPFGRTGPVQSSSAAGRQKPEFSGPGGNWGWDENSGLIVERDPSLTPVTLRPSAGGRLFSNAWGTSYAAPRVAHEIADIADHYPDASANLLRALTALSGTPPWQVPNPHAGTYGFPVAARVAESTADHAICVLEGEIETNSYQLVRLPIPAEFSAGRWDREVRVSLAYDPPVRRSRRDYIAGHMRFDLVRNYSEAQLQQIYREQPTRAERAAGAEWFERPGKRNLPDMRPVVTALGSDTLICRSFRSGGAWDANDSDFYLVLEHTQSQWSDSQRAGYPSQRYGLAVELIRHETIDLDLHALMEAELRLESRGRVR
ncbi:hypothetical protein DEI95_05125 [Curtobacterium sp. MCBD17_008]|nr:hypothetical protein DEI95_05125 [Curtobacterium sp. MCBD17_008]